MGTVSALWRHPIKAHGRESVGHVSLVEEQTFPWDRRYAVAHERAKTDEKSTGLFFTSSW